MTVIDLGEALRLPAARDEGNERGEMLSRWLALILHSSMAARRRLRLPARQR
jgi:hypothetical protein